MVFIYIIFEVSKSVTQSVSQSVSKQASKLMFYAQSTIKNIIIRAYF